MEKELYTEFPGALVDTRSEEEKAKDFKHEEIASAPTAPVWVEKKLSDFATLYPIRDQDGSSSCVAQTLALILGIENKREEGRFVELSAKDIYTRRTNSGGGMIGVEAMEIGRKYGATLEVLIPSQQQGESSMNIIDRKESDIQISQIFKSAGYVQAPFDIDTIASIMEQYRAAGIAKPFMTWYSFPRAEWDSFPEIGSSNNDIVNHSVTAIDYGIVNGKKCLITQDSWGLNWTTEKGMRAISEEYIKKRMFFCAYTLNLDNKWRDNLPTPTKPTVHLTKTLKFGMTDPEVSVLQTALRYLQLYPQTTDITGYFGAITKKGVEDFQKKYGLTADGIVGVITRAKINSLF